jgi:hypothetical protein
MIRPLAIIASLLLAGCMGPSSPRLDTPDGPAAAGGGSPGELVSHIAIWGTAVGAFAAVAAIAVAIFWSRRVGIQLLVAGIGTTIACQLLLWVGQHLAIIAGLGTIVAALVAGWIYRHQVEARLGLDLDRDGVVGAPPVADEEAVTP